MKTYDVTPKHLTCVILSLANKQITDVMSINTVKAAVNTAADASERFKTNLLYACPIYRPVRLQKPVRTPAHIDETVATQQ